MNRFAGSLKTLSRNAIRKTLQKQVITSITLPSRTSREGKIMVQSLASFQQELGGLLGRTGICRTQHFSNVLLHSDGFFWFGDDDS